MRPFWILLLGVLLLLPVQAYSDQTKDIWRDVRCTADGALGEAIYVRRAEGGTCHIVIWHEHNSLTFRITLENVAELRVDVDRLFVSETCPTYFVDCPDTHYRTWLELQEATYWIVDTTHDAALTFLHFPEPAIVLRDGESVPSDSWSYADDTFTASFVVQGLHEYLLGWNVPPAEPGEPFPFPWWLLVLVLVVVVVVILASRRR